MLGKLGRKISCNYKRDVRCAGLTHDKKLCYLINYDEERYNEKHEFEIVFCSFLPESEKVAFIAAMNEQGFLILERWMEGL